MRGYRWTARVGLAGLGVLALWAVFAAMVRVLDIHHNRRQRRLPSRIQFQNKETSALADLVQSIPKHD